MILKKVTTGFVIQSWDDENKKFVGQEFICGDDADWEDDNGNRVDVPETRGGAAPYLHFEMKQPHDIH